FGVSSKRGARKSASASIGKSWTTRRRREVFVNPAKYYEWWQFSGVCPGIPTRAANHACLREKLSAAGVTVIVLWELILMNADIEDEVFYITETGIFGCRERIGEAARAVGAAKLADYMPV